MVRVNKAELTRKSKAGLAAGLGPPRGWGAIFGRTWLFVATASEFAAKHLMVYGGVTVGQQGRQSQRSGEEQGHTQAWLPLGVSLTSSSQQWPSERDGCCFTATTHMQLPFWPTSHREGGAGKYYTRTF